MNPNDKQPQLFAEPEAPEGSKTVSFRVDNATYQRLATEAKDSKLTVGALAKQRALGGTSYPASSDDLRERMEHVESHLVALRSDLILSVEVLLFTAGRFSKEQAKTWVDERIRPKTL